MSDPMLEDDPRYEAVRAHVRDLRQLWRHASLFCAVNFGLLLLDFFTGPGLWFHWPLIIWGGILLYHAVWIRCSWDLFGPEWEKKVIARLIRRDREQQKNDPD